MIVVFGVGVLLDLCMVFIPAFWKVGRYIAGVALALLSVWLGYFMLSAPFWLASLLLFVSVFRIISYAKIVRRNLNLSYLKSVSRRTTLYLSIVSVALLGIGERLNATLSFLPFILFALSLAILAITTKNLQKTRHHVSSHFFTDKELPTVSVLVPARNETDELASCLRTILANGYPKLEVLVYDDCSQDRTAEVIKDFAHDGVRFIAGEPPHDRWLAKNQAYEKLAHEASGQVLLFCGVDVRFGPQTIRTLVSSMLIKERSMMSVLPFRIGGGANTSLIQPLRYWWELALPRRLFNKPPVLSTCWLITAKFLKSQGYFASAAHNILPERAFAREAIKNDGYSFIRSDEMINVRTIKTVEAQLKTAIRTRYPSLRKRPENVLMLISCELVLLGGPIVYACYGLLNGFTASIALASLALAPLILSHYLIMSASHPLHSILAFFNFPFAVLSDIYLTLASMYGYEFGEITWKDRNICIPTMHVYKKLPELK